jgi:hypothetical protein
MTAIASALRDRAVLGNLRRMTRGELAALVFLLVVLALNIAQTVARGFHVLDWLLYAAVVLVMGYHWRRSREA